MSSHFNLPVGYVVSCEGCGAKCCKKIGMPPFSGRNPDLGPQIIRDDETPELKAQSEFDEKLFETMPAELRSEHADLLRSLAQDPTGTPCSWLDVDTGRCVNHEWRPHTCRIYENGSDDCLFARFLFQSPKWRDASTPDDWRNPRRPQPV